MRSGLIASLTIVVALAAARPAAAQEPVPPADLPSPGAVAVEGEVVVTRQLQARVKLRCIQGEVTCTGTVRVRSAVPVAPGKGKPRRHVVFVDGSFGELGPGEVRTLELPVSREARHRLRAYRSTRVEWQTFRPDGVEHFLFIPHRTTLTSRVVR
jgi:hypothetical protein